MHCSAIVFCFWVNLPVERTSVADYTTAVQQPKQHLYKIDLSF